MANRSNRFTTGRVTYGFATRAVKIFALVVLASVAAASCTVTPPVATKTTAVYELRVNGKLVQRIDATWTTEPDSGLPFEPPRE